MPLSSQKMLLLAGLSAANLAVGVALQLSGVFALGAGASTDAYFAAQTLPMIVGAILAGALVNNLTPLLAAQNDERRAALVRAVIIQVALPVLAIVVLLSLTAYWWGRALFFGLDGETSELVSILAPAMCAIFGINILTSAGIAGHNADGKFVLVEAIQLAVAVASLSIAMPVTNSFGIAGFVGLLLARAAIVFLLIGFGYLKTERVPVPELTRLLWARVARILTGSVVFKLGPVVDRSLASLAFPGALTSLGVGQQIASAAAGVTDRVLTKPLLASAGARIDSPDRQAIIGLYRGQLRIVLWCAAAILLVAASLAISAAGNDPLADRVHLHAFGRFDLILLVAITAIPTAASQLSSSLMYAIGDPGAISRLAILSFLLSSIVKIVGFFLFGVYAIVVGMFLYQTLNWWFLHAAALRVLRKQGVGVTSIDAGEHS